MYKEGTLRQWWGRYPDALRWYGRGVAAAKTLADEELRTRYLLEFGLGYAQVRFRQGKFHDCIERLDVVVQNALAADDSKTLAAAYLALHIAHTLIGSPHRKAFGGVALPLYEELGDLSGQASALMNLGIDAYYEGDWEKALDLYERSRRLRDRIGDAVSAAMATNNIGEILSDQGHLDEATTLFNEVAATCDRVGERWVATLARANLGRVAARAGDHDEATHMLADAAESFRAIQATSFAIETETRVAEVMTLRGEQPG